MVFRKAEERDIDAIEAIMAEARRFMAENGVVQWVNGYPSRADVAADVAAEDCWVMEDELGVCASVTVITEGEPTYDRIYGGEWLTGSGTRYIAMHRVAVADRMRGKGVAPMMVEAVGERACREGFESIRIDTHRDNRAMQRMLEKTGFRRCGIIYLANGSERIAFERVER
jgi:ribosomal protein S18 acetylase RimI-like enzyme